MRRGDVATTQALIVAGANLNAKNVKCENDDFEDENDEGENEVLVREEEDGGGENLVLGYDDENDEIDENDESEKGVITPLEISTRGTNNACRVFVEDHAVIIAVLTTVPGGLVTSVVAHCAALSASKQLELIPKPILSLQAYHFDPSFLWAPSEARELVFKWARDAFLAQLAAETQPFADLPEDCAGDILEYMEMGMPRGESLLIAMHCSSLEARAWVRAVLAVKVAVNMSAIHEKVDVLLLRALISIFLSPCAF